MAPRTRDQGYDERREQIAAAAARVFAEKGFSGATNRDIARAAGISPGLIYWYFENKADLFAAVVERLAPMHAGQIPPEVADALPVEEFLGRLAQGVLAAFSQPEIHATFRLVLGEAIRFPEASQRLGDLLTRHPIGYLAAYFERQIARGRIQAVDPWLAAQTFLGALIGYVARKYVAEHADLQEVDDADMAATVTRLFSHGLLLATVERSSAEAAEGATDGCDR